MRRRHDGRGGGARGGAGGLIVALTPFTDDMIFALSDGICVGVAWKIGGRNADTENRRTKTEWAKRGFDVLTLHKDHPDAVAYFNQLATHTRARADEAAAL
jgi:hypothetical protein